MILHRTNIEIVFDFPAFYLSSEPLAHALALELQAIMVAIEQKETVAGRQMLSIEGTIDHQTGEAWITMLTVEHVYNGSRGVKHPLP